MPTSWEWDVVRENPTSLGAGAGRTGTVEGAMHHSHTRPPPHLQTCPQPSEIWDHRLTDFLPRPDGTAHIVDVHVL